MARTSWHPAFAQAIEHELEDSKDALTFETEHQLTTEPLRIDVLIIKKKRNVVIKKNIAQIFRANNVIEYKSPSDRVTIEDYHKVQCYSKSGGLMSPDFGGRMPAAHFVIIHEHIGGRMLLGEMQDRT